MVRIATYDIIPTRSHRITNIDAQGVWRSVINLESVGSVGPIYASGVVSTDNENNISDDFTVLRSTGGGLVTLNGPVILDIHVMNNRSAPKPNVTLFPADPALLQFADSAYIRTIDGTYFFRLADDAAKWLPATRSVSAAAIDVVPMTRDRTYHAVGCIIEAERTGNQSTLLNSTGMAILDSVLSGTTGTDGNVSISLNPAGSSRLYIENRSGAAEYMMVRCPALVG